MPNSPSIEISQPRLFTPRAVLALHAYNVLLVIPVFVALLIVSLMKLSAFTVVIPFVAIVAATWYLPFGLGNSHVTRVVRSLEAPDGTADWYIVQLAVFPRLRSGLRALVEDADDVGYLTITRDGVEYQGDSVKLTIPWDNIREVKPQNVGMRGAFSYGRRIELAVSGLDGVAALEFAERASRLLPESKKITREICQKLFDGVR